MNLSLDENVFLLYHLSLGSEFRHARHFKSVLTNPGQISPWVNDRIMCMIRTEKLSPVYRIQSQQMSPQHPEHFRILCPKGSKYHIIP